MTGRRRIVIIGGGFAGLTAARSLRRTAVDVTLVDRRNFHLFQPLLYQVATGGLSPGDIASPLRGILARQRNVRVLQATVTGFDLENNRVLLEDDGLPFDELLVATGAKHHYFGNDSWSDFAPGLKTIENALEMRRRIFSAFERAEREEDPERRRAWLTFIVVGGGPTGVELAGALSELAHHTLRRDFRSIDPADSKILLVEGTSRLLTAYPESLSREARHSLEKLGVSVRTNTQLEDLNEKSVTLATEEGQEVIETHTVLWGAGVRGSSLGRRLAQAAGLECDKQGRVPVQPDLSIAGYPHVFVLGDLARCEQDGELLPGVAPVAMQQGKYVARLLRQRLKEKPTKPFRYKDRGSMAVIGRSAAVAEIGRLRLHGFPAWLIWLFIHLINLVGHENRILVLIQWGWNYMTRNRSARLITYEQEGGPPGLDESAPPSEPLTAQKDGG